MENLFLDDRFFPELEDLIEHLDLDEEAAAQLPDEWSIVCGESEPEKIFVLDMDTIVDAVIEITDRWEERFPEDSERTFEKLKNAIRKGIDLEKINSALPELYYPTGKDVTITKADIVAYLK